MSKKFYDYFKESMNAAGVPAPDEMTAMFGSITTATASLAVLKTAIQSLGASATAAELLTGTGVALASDVLLVLAAIPAAYYLGALIGAIAYATGQVLRDATDSWTSNSDYQLMHNMTASGLPVNKNDMVRMLNANNQNMQSLA
jgi:hypothetical protein